MLIFGKMICLILMFTYGLTYIGRLVRGQSISVYQLLFTAVGAAGFVTLQWLI